MAWIAGYKLVVDGSNHGCTGLQRAPFLNSDSRGLVYMPKDELKEAVLKRVSKGWHLAIHDNGDAAITRRSAILDDIDDWVSRLVWNVAGFHVVRCRRHGMARLVSPVGWLLSALAAPVLSETDFSKCPSVLTPYEAVYVSRYNNLSLEGKRSLVRRDSGEWVLSHTVKNIGSRVSERSVLMSHGDSLRAQRYDRKQSIFGVRREDHARFDWSAGVIETSGRQERRLPLQGMHFDPLSYQLALRCDISRGMDNASYPVVRRGKVKTYRFRRVDYEQLDTLVGRLDTVVVERVRENDERSTRIWLAPSLNYLLVRLEQKEREGDLDISLRVKAIEFR